MTIRLVKAEIAILKTKLPHVDIHNHWLRQEVQSGAIDVTDTESAKMADRLTKALSSEKFERFWEQMALEDVAERLRERREAEGAGPAPADADQEMDWETEL